jgi:hypothetical protein
MTDSDADNDTLKAFSSDKNNHTNNNNTSNNDDHDHHNHLLPPQTLGWIDRYSRRQDSHLNITKTLTL